MVNLFNSIVAKAAQCLLYLALHVERNSSFPKPLSKKEEAECFERMAQGDEKARDTLIEHNLRLVAHVIKKYYASGNDQDDLISIGTIGLIKAVSTFQNKMCIRDRRILFVNGVPADELQHHLPDRKHCNGD